jgi:hypothetical protein
MRTSIKILLGIFIFLFSIQSFAFKVTVQSPSKEVSALGFTVNGKNSGGLGKSYTKNNMQAGNYTFGIRINGMFGTDVGCKSANGKSSFSLKSDTVATLSYKNNSCLLKISSK